jgi:hypothetical protein
MHSSQLLRSPRLLCLCAILIGVFSFAATAQASGPPIVTPGEVTEKSLNTAVLKGTVNNNGSPTSFSFEYGKTKLYGKSIGGTGSGGEVQAVSAKVFGLEPITTYHFRIKATNAFGTTYSADATFEMLLAWKINGKYLSESKSSEYPNNEPGEYVERSPTSIFTVEGTPIGIKTKITCESTSNLTEWTYGVLGSKYHWALTKCKTLLNGVENKNCTPPSPMSLDLDSLMVPVNKYLLLGPPGIENECPIGEKLLFPPGFEIGAMTEAVYQKPTISGSTSTYSFTINNGEWGLRGPWLNQKFGIS